MRLGVAPQRTGYFGGAVLKMTATGLFTGPCLPFETSGDRGLSQSWWVSVFKMGDTTSSINIFDGFMSVVNQTQGVWVSLEIEFLHFLFPYCEIMRLSESYFHAWCRVCIVFYWKICWSSTQNFVWASQTKFVVRLKVILCDCDMMLDEKSHWQNSASARSHHESVSKISDLLACWIFIWQGDCHDFRDPKSDLDLWVLICGAKWIMIDDYESPVALPVV